MKGVKQLNQGLKQANEELGKPGFAGLQWTHKLLQTTGETGEQHLPKTQKHSPELVTFSLYSYCISYHSTRAFHNRYPLKNCE